MRTDTPLFLEAKRLHAMGFSLLWLYPKSKRPIGFEWAKAKPKSWEELSKSYRDEYNVGVRLGRPSQIGTRGFLAVIDVDIKSPEKRHRQEALLLLRKLIGDNGASANGFSACGFSFPEVRSGRGNGSRHIYCLTKKPFKTWNPGFSTEVVKVLMPSKRPSKKEIETLTGDELKKGWRLSRAWEISLYSQGRQVVLPPSIHPDTEKPYVWKAPLDSAGELPLLDFEGIAADGEENNKAFDCADEAGADAEAKTINENEHSFDFKPDKTLDIRWLPGVSEPIRDLIVKGTWRGQKIEDRSSFLLTATTGLVSAGLDRDGVLSVLTDKATHLGECAYDHAKTDSRKRAAQWLWNYTVKRIMTARDASLAFRETAIVNKTLDNEAQVRQTDEIEESKPSAEERGYYNVGKRGALIPDYASLLSAFSEEHPFKTITEMKTVFAFNGTHYQTCTALEIKNFAERKLNPKPQEIVRVEFLNKVLANNLANRDFFNESTKGKFNFKNGILNVLGDDHILIPHSPQFGFRCTLPYDYDPAATCPVFRRWLRDVMCGDISLEKILQEFMGYVVRGGDYTFHKALWLGGVGRNGKSTFVDILKALIGPHNYTTLSIKSLIGDKFAGSELDGKLANFSEETSPQELADSGPFKNLTGDGELIVQKKFGDLYAMRNRAKLIMTYNTIPDVKDLSNGMLSRPLIVPFEKKISEKEQDRNIKEKLFAELPGIFNFALNGWKRLERKGGFTQNSKSELALKVMKEESCTVYQWVEGNIEFTHEDFYEDDDSAETKNYRPAELYSFYMRSTRFPFKYLDFCKRLALHPKMAARKSASQGKTYYGKIKRVIA